MQERKACVYQAQILQDSHRKHPWMGLKCQCGQKIDKALHIQAECIRLPLSVG